VKRCPLICTLIAVTLIFGVFVVGYGPRSGSAADDSSTVATERWEEDWGQVLTQGRSFWR